MSEQTHKAVLTLTSVGRSDDVEVSIQWEPVMNREDLQKLGYLPAAFQFIQTYILPALESAATEDLDAPETTKH